MVTCHDLDAVQAALPAGAVPFAPSRFLASGILDGLARAAHVACVSQATSDELLATGRVEPDRISVVHAGVHPSCVPADRRRRDAPAGRFLLHVGSTIQRKRIDVLLRDLSGRADNFPELRLRRVGGVTDARAALRSRLSWGSLMRSSRPNISTRPALAACYRAARLVVLPSEREGFGLPVVEAMACGTPVVASDIPALEEVGGSAAVYCPVGDVDRWVETISALLREEQHEPSASRSGGRQSIANASRFNWNSYAIGDDTPLRVAASATTCDCMRVLHLGKFYPPAKGGIETILKLVCDRTSPEVRNRVLVANHEAGGMTERDGDTMSCACLC